MDRKGFQEYSNTLSFYAGSLKRSVLFDRADRLMRYARGYVFVIRLIRYLSLAVAFIETSATLIVITSAALALIPVFMISALSVHITGRLQIKKYEGRLRSAFERAEKVTFIYSRRGFYGKRSAFLRGIAADFVRRGHTVFVVCRRTPRGGMSGVKMDSPGLWIVKLNCFYTLKKRFIAKADKAKTIYIS